MWAAVVLALRTIALKNEKLLVRTQNAFKHK